MQYSLLEWNLQTLINYYDTNKINLNPPYQRGDIWSQPAKKRLIESIKLKYPLPIFFLYQNSNGTFDMVDGQQRTRTIIGYAKGFFLDLNRQSIEESDKHFFLVDYKISINMITRAEEGEIEDFYYRVNKFGTTLNRPEILKAQFGNTILQKLVERIADSTQFISLNLFSISTLNRLSDLDFIAELLTLIKYGITDKKLTVDKFYEDKMFTEEDMQNIEKDFFNVLDDIIRFNDLVELKNTRYKQRNDFYTLFNFLLFNRQLHKNTLDYFYKILVLVGPDISPSQEKCFAFQEYAVNCVSQSNSKTAREERLKFFNELLLNKISTPQVEREPENTIEDVMRFYQLNANDLIKLEDYYTLDVNKLMAKTGKILK